MTGKKAAVEKGCQLRDPTLPPPKVRRRSQLSKGKSSVAETPWRHHFQLQVLRGSQHPHVQKSARHHMSRRLQHRFRDVRKDDGADDMVVSETPENTADTKEAELAVEASPADGVAETNRFAQDRELIETRLRRMRKQTLTQRVTKHEHVMDLPC